MVLTFHCLNKLSQWSQNFCKFSAFSLKFQKFFSITRTIFSHRTILVTKYHFFRLFSSHASSFLSRFFPLFLWQIKKGVFPRVHAIYKSCLCFRCRCGLHQQSHPQLEQSRKLIRIWCRPCRIFFCDDRKKRTMDKKVVKEMRNCS